METCLTFRSHPEANTRANMTDRVRVLTVYLDQDIRTDDLEPLVAAIKQLRHVERVDPLIAPPTQQIAVMTAKMELRRELYEKLRDLLLKD